MSYELVKMDDFIRDNKMKMTAARAAANPTMPESRDMDHWRVQIHAGRSRMTIYFSMGYGHNGAEPDLPTVLECLKSDAESAGESFEGFCSELGYNPDSRTAERVYKACLKAATQLRRLLGESAYNTLLERVERL